MEIKSDIQVEIHLVFGLDYSERMYEVGELDKICENFLKDSRLLYYINPPDFPYYSRKILDFLETSCDIILYPNPKFLVSSTMVEDTAKELSVVLIKNFEKSKVFIRCFINSYIVE
jgi:hypothetical protein